MASRTTDNGTDHRPDGGVLQPRDPAGIALWARTGRARPCRPDRMHLSSHDEPVSIGHDQVTTQPTLIAAMIEALDPSDDDVVLKVGTGCAYLTALLAHLARFVWSVERLPDLAAAARSNLAAADVVNADGVTGDGSQGLPEHAPYNCIVVAAAFPQVPSPLVEQLAPNGRLVQPIGPGGDEEVLLFERRGDAAPGSPGHPRRLRPSRRCPRLPHHKRI